MRRLLESIGKAVYPSNDITLIVSIDESDKSDLVEEVARAFTWEHGEKIIRRFPQRQGLRNHITQCGDLSEQYGAVIILEDDLYVSPGFYSYAQQAHARYDDDPRIAGVSLYSNGVNVFSCDRFVPAKDRYDNFFGQYIITWGQSWSFDQWKRYKAWFLEHEDRLPAINDAMPLEILKWTQSWGKYFISYMVENDLYYVVPYAALSTNFSELGEHKVYADYETAYQVPLLAQPMDYRFAPFDEGVKYDCFFERIYFGEIEPGISGKDVCFDLYGTRVTPLGKRYLLTCKKYDFPLVKTYGLRMRPMEENVLNRIEGDDISLYRIRGDEVLAKRERRGASSETVPARIQYEVQGLRRRQLAPLMRRMYCQAFVRKVKKVLHLK